MISAEVRLAVRARAADRCEYCQRNQADSPLIPLHLEHVVPRKHGGLDGIENLAMASSECNLHKGTNLTGIDPQTNEVTILFNPRSDEWERHFRWDGLRIIGLTAIGRTTVRVLELNSPERLRVRLPTRST